MPVELFAVGPAMTTQPAGQPIQRTPDVQVVAGIQTERPESTDYNLCRGTDVHNQDISPWSPAVDARQAHVDTIPQALTV